MKSKTFNKLFIAAFLFFIAPLPSFAEKVPVKIAPIQIISTNQDEIEIGDSIPFEIVKDVYINDKLYIKKETQINGVVDFVHPNGWGADCAQIVFKNFYTKDVNNNIITFSYPLTLNGNDEMANETRQVASSRIVLKYGIFNGLKYSFRKGYEFITPYNSAISRYFPFLFRGAEIFVEPDTKIYNVFIEHQPALYSRGSADL